MLQRLDYAILLQSSELAIYLLAKTSTYKKKVFIKYQSELFVGMLFKSPVLGALKFL